MRKSFILIAAAVISLAAASCKKEMAPLAENLVKVSFKADFQPVDKAGLLDGKTIDWEMSDSIAVWDGAAVRVFHAASVDGSSATFYGEVGEEATEFYLVSPFTAFKSVAEGTLTISVPSSQKAVAGGIDPAALVQTAYTDDLAGGVSFKNAISLAKFTIDREGIGSVTLSGNAAEKISGNATTDATGETITGAGSASISVAPESGEFENGTYYAAIVPTSFESGVKVFFAGSSVAGLLSTASAIEFPRNGGRNLGAVASNAKTVSVPNPIMTTEQLMAFNELAALYPAGGTVKLGADISLEGKEWTAVDFAGNFDGQGHAITKLGIESDTNAGFFNNLSGNVSNLTFGAEDDGSYVRNIAAGTTNNYYCAPIIRTSGSANITNVTNYATVEAAGENSYYNAGVVASHGSNGSVSGCKNYGTVTCTAETKTHINIAGVVASSGKEGSSIINCTNYGHVSFDAAKNNGSLNFGGVIGYCGGAVKIEGCVNEGTVEVTNNVTGGAEAHIGGVLGYSNTASMASFDNNVNKGTILDNAKTFSGQKTYLGGVVGFTNNTANKSVISNCTNEGSVTNKTYTTYALVGGIVGFVQSPSTIKNCINKEAVINNGGTSHSSVDTLIVDIAVGGIAGRITGDATVQDCENQAAVTNTGKIKTAKNIAATGGIIGAVTPSIASGKATAYNTVVKDCLNKGIINDSSPLLKSGKIYVGGIIGSNHSKGAITNCDNQASVSKTPNTTGEASTSAPIFIGGIIGSLHAYSGNKVALTDCSDCDNTGDVTINANSSTNCYAGGCIGNWCSTGTFTVSGFTNSGNVTDDTTTGIIYLGGICANAGNGAYTTHSLTATFSKCKNNGNVSISSNNATNRIAGICGSYYGKPTITECVNEGDVTINCKAKSKTLDMGGMMGKNTGSTGTFTSCTNSGKISCLNCTLTLAAISCAGIIGNGKGSPFTSCVNTGDILVDNGEVTVTNIWASGMIGYASAACTIKSCTANQALSSTAATNKYIGTLLGQGSGAPAITLSGVAGSIDGTAIGAENWTTMLYGKIADTSKVNVSGDENSCYLISE